MNGSLRPVRIFVGVGLCAATLLLPSCPPPFGDLTVLHLKDTVGPVISISSPAEGSSYGSTVIVSGTVVDSASTAGAAGEVKSLSYEITPATLPGGSVAIREGGTFDFRFDTGDFSGPMVLRLVAVDWNGNQGEARLNLVDAGAVPSFHADAGNHQVTLSWDPVPLTGGYTLYYTTDGTQPSQTYGYRLDGVQSPFVLQNLGNGSMHVFVLQAHAREGRDNWSGYVQAIPLSPRTLAPVVTGQFQKILVEWSSIPATEEFEVLRAQSLEGPYLRISGGVRGHRFVDSMVEQGTTYFYKVMPCLSGSIESTAIGGSPGEWPTAQERRIGSFLTPAPAMGLAVRNGYGFVACGDAGIEILDLANPASPSLVRSVSVPGPAWNVVLDQSRALVPGCETGLHIFDITGPTTLQYRGSYSGSTVTGVATRGDIAYTAGGSIEVLDISDPAAPVLLHTHTDPGGWFPVRSTDVVVSGNSAFAIYSMFEVHDITDPANPIFEIGTAQGVGGGTMVAVPQRLSLLGNYAYAAYGLNGVTIFDVSVPAAPILVGSLDTNGYAISTTAAGSRAYVADGPAGVVALDVSVPWTPTPVVRVDTPDEASAIVVNGDIAYVADGGSGVQVLDIRVPSPVGIGSFSAPDQITDISVVGTLAYVAFGGSVIGSSGGIEVVDLSTPTAPAVLGTCLLPGSAEGIVVSGSYAFVGDAEKGLKVIDVSNPASPTVVSTYAYSLPVGARPVSILGDLACVGFTGFGLVLFDISDPLQPCFLSSQGMASETMNMSGVVNKDGRAYVTDIDTGFAVYDLSDPGALRKLGGIDTPGSASALAVDGARAYIADGGSGLQVIDISTPSAPTILGTYAPAGVTADFRDVAVCGSYALVSDTGRGLLILDVSDPTTLFEMARFPSSSKAVAIAGRFAVVSDGMSCHVVDLAGGR